MAVAGPPGPRGTAGAATQVELVGGGGRAVRRCGVDGADMAVVDRVGARAAVAAPSGSGRVGPAMTHHTVDDAAQVSVVGSMSCVVAGAGVCRFLVVGVPARVWYSVHPAVVVVVGPTAVRLFRQR